MKISLLIAVVLAAVATVCDSSPRQNLNVGWISAGDRVLYNSPFSRAPIANSVQSQDIVWRGNANNRISAVRAIEVGVSQRASARIIAGGVGYNNVTVRFQSYRGRGYNFNLDIWGR